MGENWLRPRPLVPALPTLARCFSPKRHQADGSSDLAEDWRTRHPSFSWINRERDAARACEYRQRPWNPLAVEGEHPARSAPGFANRESWDAVG